MTWDALPLIAAAFIAVAVFWSLPHRYAQDGFAAVSAIALFVLSPFSAIWLVGSVVVVQGLMALGERGSRRGPIIGFCIIGLCVAFAVSRESKAWFGQSWAIVGIAYSTLRHIRVLIEYYLRRIPTPSLRDYARYHLLLPVMLAGPIHRLPHFQRQCERRRWSAEEFFSGAERALFGLAMVVVLGEYIGNKVQAALGGIGNNFAGQWLLSAIDWFQLYFRFAGLTSIALGLCLMIGLTLEENFNQPWRARNLVEFWTRWHMTLSLWCRDYVFFPVAAYFRSALIGIFCAMLVMGLWHQFSLFYVLWGFYQAAGIALSQIYLKTSARFGFRLLPAPVMTFVSPFLVLAWLAGARPVVNLILASFGL